MSCVAAIIQARMGSTRLPGKVLAPIAGHPMLWHVVRRARLSQRVDTVLVATSTASADDPVAAFCAGSAIPHVRGSEDDVLDRYHQAAQQAGADVIVRITADCPLLDSATVDLVVGYFLEGDYDYVSNTDPPTYPDGLDIEVFSASALEHAWREARLRSEREHVTPYIRNHPQLFRHANVANDQDLSSLRWTVDEEADLAFVRAVYEQAGSDSFTMGDVLTLLQQHSHLFERGRLPERNEGLIKSLREDYVL